MQAISAHELTASARTLTHALLHPTADNLAATKNILLSSSSNPDLSSLPPLDGIICTNHSLATGVVQGFCDCKQPLNQDIKLLTFDHPDWLQVLPQKIAALTFDDGPHPVYTEILLDGLKERNVKATFFLIGKCAEQYPELVRRMAEEGHLVGNHTMNHVQLNHLTFDQALEEIRQCSQVIRDLTGQAPRHIRPPFGEWGDELEEKVNMTAVLWDVDPCDWKMQDADTVVKRVLRDVEDGDIILLHDVYSSSVEAALELIDIMKEDGYAFGTAEEILVD